jgi:3-hydroxybutyryl-CoA dehydrogenase
MSKAKIAVIGAGLMGHGIAQVFALAGHHVTITDSFHANLDTVKARISANLRDLGDDERAVDRVTPLPDLGQTVREADYVVEAVSEDLPRSSSTCGRTRSWPATLRSSRSPRS